VLILERRDPEVDAGKRIALLTGTRELVVFGDGADLVVSGLVRINRGAGRLPVRLIVAIDECVVGRKDDQIARGESIE